MSTLKRQRTKNRSRYVEYGGQTDKYTWDQWEDEAVVSIPFGPETKSKDITYQVKSGYLKLGKKGQPPIFDGQLYQEVLPEDCSWIIDDKGNVELTLCKAPSGKEVWWSCIVIGQPEIDVKAIDGAKYLDDSILEKIWRAKQEEKKKKQQEAEAGAAPSSSSAVTTNTQNS